MRRPISIPYVRWQYCTLKISNSSSCNTKSINDLKVNTHLDSLPQRPRAARGLGCGCRSCRLAHSGWIGGLLDSQRCGLSPGGNWLLCGRRRGPRGCFPGIGASSGRLLHRSPRGCGGRNSAGTVLALMSLSSSGAWKRRLDGLRPCRGARSRLLCL